MRVYKYLAPDRVDVLARQRIRFTPPNALNDPYELKPFFEKAIDVEDAWALLTKEPIDITDQLEEAYRGADRQIREAVSLSQFKDLARAALESEEGQRAFFASLASAIDLMNEMTPQIQSGIHSAAAKTVGLLSLSEVPDSEVMWAHYGDQNRGFLVEFDSTAPFFNRRRSDRDECYWLRQVDYREVRTLPSLYGTKGEDILLMKGCDWELEREWRMLAPLEDADEVIEIDGDTIHFFQLPPDCVTGLISGASASAGLREELATLRNSSQYSHVRLGEFQFKNHEPGLSLVWLDS